jgi:hypothetical protein
VKIAGWQGNWMHGVSTSPSSPKTSPSARPNLAVASGSCLPPSRLYRATNINIQSLDTTLLAALKIQMSL